jgi:hypothetical protein
LQFAICDLRFAIEFNCKLQIANRKYMGEWIAPYTANAPSDN